MQVFSPRCCLVWQARCSLRSLQCWLTMSRTAVNHSSSNTKHERLKNGRGEEGGVVVDPQEAKCDYIGPADHLSNMRPLRFYIPPSETKVQQRYREQRAATQDWNQQFWADHNVKYKKMKEEFIRVRLKEKYGDDAKDHKTLSADEMSEFYKLFLDAHREIHSQYNREWYTKNVSNLVLAARVWLQQKFNTGK